MEFFLGMMATVVIVAVLMAISAILEWKDGVEDQLRSCRGEWAGNSSRIGMMGDDIKRLKGRVEKLEEGSEQDGPDTQERPDAYDIRQAIRNADINRKRGADSDGQEDVS